MKGNVVDAAAVLPLVSKYFDKEVADIPAVHADTHTSGDAKKNDKVAEGAGCSVAEQADTDAAPEKDAEIKHQQKPIVLPKGWVSCLDARSGWAKALKLSPVVMRQLQLEIEHQLWTNTQACKQKMFGSTLQADTGLKDLYVCTDGSASTKTGPLVLKMPCKAAVFNFAGRVTMNRNYGSVKIASLDGVDIFMEPHGLNNPDRDCPLLRFTTWWSPWGPSQPCWLGFGGFGVELGGVAA